MNFGVSVGDLVEVDLQSGGIAICGRGVVVGAAPNGDPVVYLLQDNPNLPSIAPSHLISNGVMSREFWPIFRGAPAERRYTAPYRASEISHPKGHTRVYGKNYFEIVEPNAAGGIDITRVAPGCPTPASSGSVVYTGAVRVSGNITPPWIVKVNDPAPGPSYPAVAAASPPLQCVTCGEAAAFADANLPGGKFRCYSCRRTYGLRP